ncbi:MAG TPA: demethoxyubiquinone hydroxylase family protein [Stellaceae bacterium]|nr:demethoxyubiquinone hydroxylase family protein [Stellaceae bacterium]
MRLPGDASPRERLRQIIRVDQAGEYGAKRIYEGQLRILGESALGPILRHMARQEARHLQAFDRLMVEGRVRPSALNPLWHVAGFALGAATALLGERAAMACTVAVEEVIDEHYRAQSEELGESHPQLAARIEEFRAEEIEHRDTALAHGAAEAGVYPLLSLAIKTGSRLAIWLATRI